MLFPKVLGPSASALAVPGPCDNVLWWSAADSGRSKDPKSTDFTKASVQAKVQYSGASLVVGVRCPGVGCKAQESGAKPSSWVQSQYSLDLPWVRIWTGID